MMNKDVLATQSNAATSEAQRRDEGIDAER
jgi:hypothetical protein